jgi:hypothetical protein
MEHGGDVYWQDLSRRSAHIISVTPHITGLLISIDSSSATILTNDAESATCSIYAQCHIAIAGQNVWSDTGTDVLYVETTGGTGFISTGWD